MPKVDKIVIQIKGERREFDIFFNTKEDFYIKDFPALKDIERISNIVVNGQSSLGKLKDALDTALRIWHEITAEQKKIIAYRLALTSGFHMNKDKNHMGGRSYVGVQSWIPKGKARDIEDFGFDSPDHAIGLSYDVYAVTQLGEKKYFKIDADGKLGHEEHETKLRGWTIIDWTEEREKGLESIVAAMQLLAERMGRVLLDPEKTINMLESGVKLIG